MKTWTASILVVDDEVDTCRNLADIFEDLDFQVDVAHDGESALELVRKQHYDVALLDLMMPGMDGATLYERIKQLRAGTVALIVTAHPGNPRAEVALTAGAWRLLPKPVDVPRLLGLVEEAMGQPLVLVVDDDTDLCQNLWDILRQQRYRVCLAHDVVTAVERIRESRFHVILVDLKLPDGDGRRLCRIAQEAVSPPQVIVITGTREETEEHVRQCLTQVALPVLHKPLDMVSLLATVQKLTHRQAELRGTV